MRLQDSAPALLALFASLTGQTAVWNDQPRPAVPRDSRAIVLLSFGEPTAVGSDTLVRVYRVTLTPANATEGFVYTFAIRNGVGVDRPVEYEVPAGATLESVAAGLRLAIRDATRGDPASLFRSSVTAGVVSLEGLRYRLHGLPSSLDLAVTETLNQRTDGRREVTLSVTCESYEQGDTRVAHVALEQARARLRWFDVVQTLNQLGLGVVQTQPLIDGSEPRDGRVCSIATLPIVLGYQERAENPTALDTVGELRIGGRLDGGAPVDLTITEGIEL